MNRSMWHQHTISAFAVELRPLAEAQLELLRAWRNSPEIASQMLSQAEISAEQQQRWFNRICQDRSQQQFVIYYKEQPIGACNVKQPAQQPIQPQATLETGFYIGESRYRGSMLAFFPALALNQYCFEQLNCKTLLANVKISNSAALRFNQQLGYQLIGEPSLDGSSDGIALQAMQLQQQHSQLAAQHFAAFIRN